MDLQDKHELFKKRWLHYRKYGVVKYAIFLGLLYSFTVLFVGVLFNFIKTDDTLSDIVWLMDKELALKSIVFFFVGLVFGIYHYKKSEKKFNA